MGDLLAEIQGIQEAGDKKKKRRTQRVSKEETERRKISKREAKMLEMASEVVLPDYYNTVLHEGELNELCEWLKGIEYVAFDTETMGLDAWRDEIVGISFYAPNPERGYYIPIKNKYSTVLPKELITKKLKPIMEDRSKKWIGHNIKFDQHVVYNWLGIDVKAYYDTSVAQSLLDENVSRKLKDLAPMYLKIPALKFQDYFDKLTFDIVPVYENNIRIGNLATYYATKDSVLTYKLYEFQMKHFNRPELSNLKHLMFEVEMPFLEIALQAERKGMCFDSEYMLNEVAPELEKQRDELVTEIRKYVGDINLNSPKQLSKVLYKDLKLVSPDKDKPTSTAVGVLEKMVNQHPVIPLIMEYRKLEKVIDSFVVALPTFAIDGRVHTSFNTAGAVTGRLSSSKPNLQQIPSKLGPLIRKAFVADKGRLLVSMDYSSQELRVLAHVSKDPVLLDAFISGKDVHALTGVSIYNKLNNTNIDYDYFQYCREVKDHLTDKDGNIDESKLTEEHISALYDENILKTKDVNEIRELVAKGKEFEHIRSAYAKKVNFGIVYGISNIGLSRQLNITEDEAQSFIDSFFDMYKGAHRWVEDIQRQVMSIKYVSTLMGRKRRLYKALQNKRIARAKRQGTNSVIQGSSAEMLKIASIKLQPLLTKYDSTIVCFVHDELIIDVPEDIGVEKLQEMADIMCNAVPLDCGMKVDIEIGKRWGEKISEEDLEELKYADMEDDDIDDEDYDNSEEYRAQVS